MKNQSDPWIQDKAFITKTTDWASSKRTSFGIGWPRFCWRQKMTCYLSYSDCHLCGLSCSWTDQTGFHPCWIQASDWALTANHWCWSTLSLAQIQTHCQKSSHCWWTFAYFQAEKRPLEATCSHGGSSSPPVTDSQYTLVAQGSVEVGADFGTDSVRSKC